MGWKKLLKINSAKPKHGASGTLTFDNNGDVIKPATIKTVRDGEFVEY